MVPVRHILSQGPMLKALGATALRGLRQLPLILSLSKDDPSARSGGQREPPVLPGPEIRATVAPLPRDLVADYVRHVGGDPDEYGDLVPAHLFPQWSFPFAARTLSELPYPMLRIVNAGCRLEMAALLPQAQPLEIRARLESLKVDERRVLLSQRIVTGTDRNPEAVVAHLYAYVPLGRKSGKSNSDRTRSAVPEDAREVARWWLPATCGLDFALLTGDFNPVHWVRPWARALGFSERILHGFSTMARTIEGLNRTVLAGRPRALESIDVHFVKPLVLPAEVGLFVKDQHVYVGETAGSAAYLEGAFVPRG